MHILLIEPDRLQARILAEALLVDSHTVAHASTAQVAVQLADEQLPDIVILEIQLPQHNGVEFLYEFRSYPEWMHIPVVLYTYLSPRELADVATLSGRLGVIRTLYKPETSLAALRIAISQAQKARAI